MCKYAGLLRVEGNYIIGGAFESTDTINESIEHAKKLIEIGRGIIEINTVFFAPYHGTPISELPKSKDLGFLLRRRILAQYIFRYLCSGISLHMTLRSPFQRDF